MATHPAVEYTQEIRFAVVMYGGVSLAIYMNGVTQELLRMVRATAPDPDAPGRALLAAEELSGSERAYRRLGQLLRRGRPLPSGAAADPPSDDAPIRTRFVVDVISGTSAGGINGIFLAKALARGASLDGLRRLWIREGDLARLLDDRGSVADLPPLRVHTPVASLLNGERMYVELLEAFREMDAAGAASSAGDPRAAHPSALVDELDLFVTTTDIRGTPVPLRLADEVASELRYRDVFHFRCRPRRNDFEPATNAVLAFAARCTSSFPFAFEPMLVATAARLQRLFPAVGSVAERPVDDGALREFLRGFPAATPADPGAPASPVERAFGDGGYLDNKPFGYAIDALAHRRAALPAERRLVYVEPDPEPPPPAAEAVAPPDALENVEAALLGIPRYETIREDLQRVLARNRLVERVESVLRGAELDAPHAPPDSRPERLSGRSYADSDLAIMIRQYGIGYGGYHRLKVAAVSDFLTDVVTRVSGLDVGSDEWYAVRYLVRAWRDAHFVHYRAEDETGRKRTMNAFLLRYDLDYRIRRLAYVRGRLDTITAGEGSAWDALLREADVPGPDALLGRLLAARADLDAALALLTAERQALLHGAPPTLAPPPAAGSLDDDVAATGITGSLLHELLAGDTEAERRAFADRLVGRRGAAFDRLAARVAERIEAVTRAAGGDAEQVLAAGAVGRAVRAIYERFEAIDLVAYPPLYAADAGGELDRVDVFRVSPEDARSIVRGAGAARRKLAGTSFYHFGAFLEERWRRNDILWGRLDGAERLIASVLRGAHAELRAALTRDAQVRILAGELRSPGAAALGPLAERASDLSDEDLFEAFRRDYVLDGSLDLSATLRSAGRATAIVGRMFRGLAGGEGHEARLLRVPLALLGIVLSALAVPPRMIGALYAAWRGTGAGSAAGPPGRKRPG